MKNRKFGRITCIAGENGSRYPYCNSLYIDDEKKVLIDPGSDETVLRRLSSSQRVDIVIASHYHEDHGCYHYLFEHSELWVHEREAPCYRSYDTYLEYSGLVDSPYQKEWHDLLVRRCNFRERSPTSEFKDGDILDFGQTMVQVIHTPGHSPGHCSFYFPNEGILFLSDMDLSPFGPWYGDRFSDIDQTRSSMNRLLELSADIYITSHEIGVVEGDITRLAAQYLEVIDQREKRLIKFLEQPRTMKEIVNRWLIYGRERKPRFFFEFGERAMIRKHLERLMKEGRVQEKNDRFVLM
jgi:glyoxylase-like metal-dependent hydrolase (beta-lactamase superfamily II)